MSVEHLLGWIVVAIMIFLGLRAHRNTGKAKHLAAAVVGAVMILGSLGQTASAGEGGGPTRGIIGGVFIFFVIRANWSRGTPGPAFSDTSGTDL